MSRLISIFQLYILGLCISSIKSEIMWW